MPTSNLSRLRKRAFTRDWISQTTLLAKDLILPYFVVEGKGVRSQVESMPGIYHLSIDNLLKDIVLSKGLNAILLFGVPQTKDLNGQEAYKKNGLVQRAVKAIRKEFPRLIIITDVCLCGYTTHGHCGIIEAKSEEQRAKGKGQRAKSKYSGQGIDLGATLKVLARIAVSHADSGADLVAPSGMMDGQVGAIREALDKNNFKDIGILAYSSKYASSFYGPFRDVLDSAPRFGDRKGYQLDFRNKNEALREIDEDIKEGADIVMVKPALAYLDIIYRAKERFNVPLAAYNVSGEYAMVEAYLKSIDTRREMILEILTSIKRAGADLIITYWAKDVLKWLR